MKKKQVITYVANTDWALLNFRKGLIKAMSKRGWSVTGACRIIEYGVDLKKCGMVSCASLRNCVKKVNPFADFFLLIELYLFYRKTKPDIVHHFTIKPVIFGTIAAYLAGVPVIINTITGLGYIFTGHGKGVLRKIVLGLYRLTSGMSNFYFFQNSDDKDFFLRNNLTVELKTMLVPGSGVDLDYWSIDRVDPNFVKKLRVEFGLKQEEKIVICVARMLFDKGIAELVKAVCGMQATKATRLLLVGPLAPGNPSAIPKETIGRWSQHNSIEYLGKRADVRELMALADVVALPTYYKEGVPKSLLEAAAMRKPIITTDIAGCRDIVRDGENGFVVPIKDVEVLQKSLEKLCGDDKFCREMGMASRKVAREMFDEEIVISKSIQVYEKMLASE